MRSFHVLILFIFAVSIQCGTFDGYVFNPAKDHGYKIMYQAKPWIEARDTCAKIGAKLAVPKSEEEFKFLQKLVRGIQYPSIIGSNYKILVWLGINNMEDYTKWINVDGENIQDTGFHTWAGYNGQTISNNPAEPHCAGMDAANFGLRDYWCHLHQAYICEINNTSNTVK